MESVATVTTSRAARYGKQLAAHMGRRISASWDGESGSLEFSDSCAVGLHASDEALTMSLECPSDEIGHFESVIGRHLARFGAREALTVCWIRDDGSEGTTQGPPATPLNRLRACRATACVPPLAPAPLSRCQPAVEGRSRKA